VKNYGEDKMLKVHQRKWGFRDPKEVWHPYEIIIYYHSGGENPWDRFVVNVPKEITLTTGRNVVTAETAEKVMEKLNSLKEEHMAIIAPKTKTKIIKYNINIRSHEYGNPSISLSIEYEVYWMVQQEGRKYRIETEDDGKIDVVSKEFYMEHCTWMPWTQQREDWFKQFQDNLIELAHKFEKFYEETFPKDAEDLGKAIDSGNLLPPFKNSGNLLTSGKE
jgi:hypothetical protein